MYVEFSTGTKNKKKNNTGGELATRNPRIENFPSHLRILSRVEKSPFFFNKEKKERERERRKNGKDKRNREYS